MLRSQVVQSFLEFYPEPKYLEVGVASGATFKRVAAAHKVAVDPRFKFDFEAEAKVSDNCLFHQTTSDAYFAEFVEPNARFDVVFLDGLHTFEQTLRDLINTLSYVHEKSVILIDDVAPNSYLSAVSDLKKHFEIRKATRAPSAQWMGDVYKLVFFIEEFLQQFTFATVADLHGVLAMWRKSRSAATLPHRGVAGISGLDYGDFVLQQEVFRKEPLKDIIERCSQDLGLTAGRHKRALPLAPPVDAEPQ